ncbi:MAG: hypothetical protein ACI9T9_001280 [Oleiphilaceae bacterium]|jgi:hypothetical protein
MARQNALSPDANYNGMNHIVDIHAFAEDNNITRQVVEYRIKAGWKFGVLDGVKVMYDPKYAFVVK